MGQLVERIDGLMQRMDRDDAARRSRQKDDDDDHDDIVRRVSSLERSRAAIAAVFTFLGVAAGWILSLLTK